MKIIFLDIDGVLNDAPTIMEKDNDLPAEDHLKCLKQIVDATGAQIILSSTWRLFPASRRDVRNGLKTVDLDFIGRTEELHDRDEEIRDWLGKHPEVESYVILDDEDEFSNELAAHQVLTTFYEGLLPKHVPLAIKILNSSEKSAKLVAGAQKDE